MPITTLLVDLDGTLYDNDLGLWQEISERINTFMRDEVGIPPEQVDQLRLDYYRDYGTSLRGLMNDYGIDPLSYLDFVHDIQPQKYIQPDTGLRQMFGAIPLRKWIFTNSDRNHSRRVVGALGLEGIFEGIVDVVAMQFRNKPEPWVYASVLKMVGEGEAGRCLLVDDSPANIRTAQELGFNTVFVGKENSDGLGHYHIQRIHQLAGVLDGLLEGEN